MPAAQLRAKQSDTLAFFEKVGDTGATITEVRKQFSITHPSARSRCMYLKDKKLLKTKKEKTATNTPLIRFAITAEGKRALAKSKKAA